MTVSIRIEDSLYEAAATIGEVLNRTPPKQVEHWAKIGKIMEENPDLSYEFVRDVLIARAEVRLAKASGQKLKEYTFGTEDHD